MANILNSSEQAMLEAIADSLFARGKTEGIKIGLASASPSAPSNAPANPTVTDAMVEAGVLALHRAVNETNPAMIARGVFLEMVNAQ